MNICQSCAMPMESVEMRGNNLDGSKSEDYCKYCYPNGNFNKPDETFEEMVMTCIPFLVEKGMEEKEAKDYLIQALKPLKRWSNK